MARLVCVGDRDVDRLLVHIHPNVRGARLFHGLRPVHPRTRARARPPFSHHTVKIAQYRLLLIAFVVVCIAGGALDLVFPALLPEEFQVAQKHLDDGLSTGRTFIFTIVGVCTLAFGIASTYGLYRVRPWAPRLALVTTVLAVLMWPFGGAFAQSGAAIGLNFLASYLWGAAVVLAHVPPLNSMFERRDG